MMGVCVRGVRRRGTGKVVIRSDELAPAKDALGIYTAGQVHGRCYCMRMLDQIHDLVIVADGGEGVGSWEYGFVGQQRGQG